MKVDIVVRAFSGYEAEGGGFLSVRVGSDILTYRRITPGEMHELYRTYCFGELASGEQGWFPFAMLGDVQAQLAHANGSIS